MHWAKQSTAVSYVVGPILDSTGAEYASAVIGDLSLSKNGGTLTALASAATLTYIANGQYTLALTTGNTDTLGTARILCNKSTYQMPTLELMVLPATVYDALTTNATNTTGGLPAATGSISALAGAISTLTAAQAATGVWQDTTAGDFTVNNSIGKSVMNGVSLGTGLTVASVSGAVGSVTGAVGSVTGNVGGNVVGSVASVTARVTANTDQLAGQTVTAAAGVTFPSSVGTSTLTQAQITGGAYALNSSSFAFNAALDFTTTQKAATLARVTLTDTLTTYTGNTPQTGDAYARIGAAGAGLTSLAPASTALSTAQWTNARAGYLDNLNVGGVVASHADIVAINQSASKHVLLQTVGQYERPESGNTVYTVEARTYSAADGSAVNADSTPTLTATGQTSGSLSGNLSAATNPATGVYRWTYTVSSAATQEPIRFDVSATINSSTFTLACYSQVVDLVSATWTSTDAAHLTAIYNKLPTGGGAMLDAAGVQSAVGLGAANLDTQLNTIYVVAGLVKSQTDQLLFNGSGYVKADVYGVDGAALGTHAAGYFPVDLVYIRGTQVAALSGGNLAVGFSNFFGVDGGPAPQSGDAYPVTTAIKATIGVAGAGLTAVALTSAYDAAKTAAQAGDAMALTSGERSTLAGVVWATLTSGLTTAGSIGKRLVDLFSGMTSLPQWIGLLAGKQVGDSTARTELRATGAGSGAFDETTDSQEAIRDRGDAAWITGSGGGGTGARTVTITVTDGADPLESARVRMTKGVASYVLSTDASGVATFNLDDGTWVVAISLTGYTFTPTTLVVSADVSHTYTMTQVTITPSDPGQVTGYLYVYDETGVVEEGVDISMVALLPDKDIPGYSYDSKTRVVTSGSDGKVEFTNLFPGVTYQMFRGGGKKKLTPIPADATDPHPLPSLIGSE